MLDLTSDYACMTDDDTYTDTDTDVSSDMFDYFCCGYCERIGGYTEWGECTVCHKSLCDYCAENFGYCDYHSPVNTLKREIEEKNMKTFKQIKSMISELDIPDVIDTHKKEI
eukprot:gene12641-6545_t